jgi:NAD(P)H-hydrate epimerase
MRPTDANKGTFGRILVIAGSRGMSGAAALVGLACLRGGAGLVRVATPRDVQPMVALASPCLMTAALPQHEAGGFAAEAADECVALAEANDVVALGPGLGRSAVLDSMLPRLLASIERPIVLDADGLNACAARPGSIEKHRGPVIITPHPGEFSRLTGLSVADVQKRRQELAVEVAQRTGVVVLLKGHGTVVTDGRHVYVNKTGNPGMAIPGAGDVLTGLIAALLGQKFEPFAAAQLGAALHGTAGDLARDRLGDVGMLATDLLDALPLAIRRHREGATA